MSSIWAVPSLGIDPANGKEMFLTKEGKVTYEWNSEDQISYESAPDVEGTLGINLFWKGFSLNAYSKYSLGGMIYNTTLVDRVENANPQYNVDARMLMDRWKQPGDQTFFKDISDKSSTRPTSRFIQEESYLQMTSLNVSYRLDSEVTRKFLKMKSLTISFYMNDLFRISTVEMERGLSYPFARSFNLKLQTRF